MTNPYTPLVVDGDIGPPQQGAPYLPNGYQSMRAAQWVMNTVYSDQLAVDGQWGPLTEAALLKVIGEPQWNATAIMRLQLYLGCGETGVVDKITAEAWQIACNNGTWP